MLTGLLSFAFSPIGRIVAIGIAFLAWTAYQRNDAATEARAECNAVQLQRALDETNRQLDAANAAVAEAAEQQKATDLEIDMLENERDRAMEAVKERAADVCAVPPAALERLRNIR